MDIDSDTKQHFNFKTVDASRLMLLFSYIILIILLITAVSSGFKVMSLTHHQFDLNRNYYILLGYVSIGSSFLGCCIVVFVEYFKKIIKNKENV